MTHLVTLEVEGDGRAPELVERFCHELAGREQVVVSCLVKKVPEPMAKSGSVDH